MEATKEIHVVSYEYSYANNLDGRPSPEDAGGPLQAFEDEDDAKAYLEEQKGSGDWGNFFDDEDANCGWSSSGYILGVEKMLIVPSSKRKKEEVDG